MRAVLLAALVTVAAPVLALEVPSLRTRVTDQAGVLAPSDEARLEEMLRTYEQQTGHQFAVLTIPTLEGDTLEEFSIRVAEQWKLGGKGRDDGLLMIVVTQDRKARIEVGYGLEGAVPDVIASRVIREDLAPHFRQGDFAGGIASGLQRLMRAAEGESLGPPVRAPRSDGEGFPFVLVLLFTLTAFLRALPAVARLVIGGGIGGALAFFFTSSLLLALGGLIGGALLGLIMGGGGRYRRRGGMVFLPFPGGGWSSGHRGGGGFSGGGGGFGGGGASGNW